MELRHLRYFVAVAEALHFGRAAERLGISQPPLSQQIQALEAELGVRLFDRSGRKVALTPAGSVFLDEARQTLAQAARAVAAARRAAEGVIGEIRIGFTASAPFTALVPRIIHAYRQSFPDVHLRLAEMPTRAQLAALNDSRIDAGFLRSPFAAIPEGIAAMTVMTDRLMLVLRAEHRLAALPVVPLAGLAHEPFVMFENDAGTGLHDQVIGLCAAHGFTPVVTQEAREAPTLIGLVAAGLGVTILPASLEGIHVAGVVFRPLDAPEAVSHMLMAHRAGERAAPAQAFIRLVRAAVAETAG